MAKTDKDFLKFYDLVKKWNAMKTASYKLSDVEINDFKKIIYDHTIEFNKNIPKGSDVTGGDKWMEGLLKKVNLSNIDKTNAKEVAKLRSYIKTAINTVKGEDYAENITNKRGIIDSKLEDIFENWSFNEKELLNNAGVKQEGEITKDLNEALTKSPFSKYFRGKGEIPDYANKKHLTEALISINPKLKEEYITTGVIDTSKAIRIMEGDVGEGPVSYNEPHPNANITLEQITERFQGGDKTTPLTVDAINALPSSIIIDNKLPLTDEARGTLLSWMTSGGAPEDYIKNFKSIYFKEEELKEVLADEIHEEDYVPDDAEEEVIEEVIPEAVTPEVVTPEVVTPEAVTSEAVEEGGEQKPRTGLEKAEDAAGTIFKGAGKVLDYIGGPGAIISYIMGKQGLKAAMKEVTPQAMPQLSPMFMQHLRQTRELAKKGFHPDEARKVKKSIDNAYRVGIENAVRGTGGDRAKFLAQSGILDSRRSSALLDFAAQDASLQRKNQDQYKQMMMFKESFDMQRTEKERAEDLEMQLADKTAAGKFASVALGSLLGNFGNTSALTNTDIYSYAGIKSPARE